MRTVPPAAEATASSNRLAEDYGVMLAPGSAFGYEGYLRIGIGQEPAVFAEGLARTARCLEAVKDDETRG